MRKGKIQSLLKKVQKTARGKKMYNELINTHFNDQMVANIIQYYQKDSYDEYLTPTEALQSGYNKLFGNPYQLAEVPYISQQFLDSLVISLPDDHPWHVDLNSRKRVSAYVTTMLGLHIDEGQSVLTRKAVLTETLEVLIDNTPEDKLTKDLKNFYIQELAKIDVYVKLKNEYPTMDEHLITSSSYHKTVQDLADNICRHVAHGKTALDDATFDTIVQDLNSQSAFNLSSEQIDVAKHLITEPISLLTGYAGTGKSTLLKLVIKYLDAVGATSVAGAISAKACFNLYNITGQAGKTIASMKYNETVLHGAKYLIIDEISMVSEADLAFLLDRLSEDSHLILVGDKAQLPAVEGVGVLTSLPNFLKKYPNAIYNHSLQTVFRQDQSSLLLKHATKLRLGEVPNNLNVRDASLKYAGHMDLDAVKKTYIKAASIYGRDGLAIITPTNSDVDTLNFKLQTYYMRQQQKQQGQAMLPSTKIHGQAFYVGDKILITKNMRGLANVSGQYAESVNILNGFVGKVVEVGDTSLYAEFSITDPVLQTEKILKCRFVDNPSTDSLGDLNYVRLGYAMTVHKAQGSTIPNVIFYLNQSVYSRMLNKELLYTAYTRAEQLFFLTDGDLRPDILLSYVQKTAYQYASSFFSQALEKSFYHDEEQQKQKKLDSDNNTNVKDVNKNLDNLFTD